MVEDEDRDEERLNLRECDEFFARLFPKGPVGEAVLAEVAPDGWAKSELLAVAHPSPQRRYEEALRMHENIEHFVSITKRKRKKEEGQDSVDEQPSAPPTLDEIIREHKEEPIDVQAECADIVARSLWDVFSDNHDVIAPDGRTVDIGSFRGAGGFIADWLNRLTGERRFDYMDFYMGTAWVSGRADLSPVYRMIFKRLKALGCDWKYSYPRLGVVRFAAPPEDPTAPYDPAAAFIKQQEEENKQKEFEEMQQNLRQTYNESVREARTLPPPETVKAYMSVYGRAPDGWPPEKDEGM